MSAEGGAAGDELRGEHHGPVLVRGKAAVGRRLAASPLSRSPAPRPSSTVSESVATRLRSLAGSPASRHAACAPAQRSRT